MDYRPRLTTGVVTVLAAFLDDPDADRYGLDLMRATGHPSGMLHPILLRLQKARWVVATWEDIDRAVAGRPARRYYRLTPEGLETARIELAASRGSADGSWQRLQTSSEALRGSSAEKDRGEPAAPIMLRAVLPPLPAARRDHRPSRRVSIEQSERGRSG